MASADLAELIADLPPLKAMAATNTITAIVTSISVSVKP
jgi:hypothetical protein